jgi:hypothetical protein
MMDDEDEDGFGNYDELDENLEQQEETVEVDLNAYWESTDQENGLNEQPGTHHPKMKDWKDINDSRMKVTFDQARTKAWRQGKQEINALRSKIASHQDDYFDWICKLLFGKQSTLFLVLSNSVSISF